MTRKTTWALLALLPITAGGALAQDVPGPPQKPAVAGTPLKVQVVYTRFQGEKKVSSMPYTLSVNADDRPTAVRAGIQVPVMVNLGGDKGTTVAYKDVGNNLDCTAVTLPDGRFKLEFSLEQGSIYSPDSAPKVGDPGFHAPVLRNFKSQTNIVLRDGQTAQYIAATDPITGETVKIDVTLNVVK